MSGTGSRSSRRGRGSSISSFTLRQPLVVDIGCNCRRPKLFSSTSSLFRGGGKPKSPNASSTTTAFTATTAGGRSGTTATSTDSSSWGPASFIATNQLAVAGAGAVAGGEADAPVEVDGGGGSSTTSRRFIATAAAVKVAVGQRLKIRAKKTFSSPSLS